MKAYRWEDGSINLFRPFENAKRFNESAERLATPVIEEARFVEGIRSLVDKQRGWVPKPPGSLYIRPTLVATEPCLGVRAANEFLFYTMVLPTGAYFPKTSGLGAVRVYVTASVGRAAQGGTGNVKAAANYAGTLAVTSKAKDKGCSQVLFLDAATHQRVEEMGGMNVFFVMDGKLVTPRLTDTILPGVTRDSILKLAPTLGFTVEERDILFDELCDRIKDGKVTEAFACGTAAVVAGIESLQLENGEEIKLASAPGPVATRLYDTLTGIQYGRIADPFDWVVKV
jgi:branched-chain amino acid aminotransferase